MKREGDVDRFSSETEILWVFHCLGLDVEEKRKELLLLRHISEISKPTQSLTEIWISSNSEPLPTEECNDAELEGAS